MPHIEQKEIRAHAYAMAGALTEASGLTEDDCTNYHMAIRQCIDNTGYKKYLTEHVGIDRIYERAAKAQLATVVSLNPDAVVNAVCSAIDAYAEEHRQTTELNR
jgi:hypothetical protein